jgi:hypothetical protein
MYDVIDRFLGSRDRDWNADLLNINTRMQQHDEEARAQALKGRPANSKPSLPLSGYVGTYSNPVVGDVQVVSIPGNKLQLSLPPGATFTLTHWAFDTFEVSDDRAPEDRFLLTFQRSADGKISGYSSEEGRSYKRK